MRVCSVCKKLSATNEDHLDCQEKRRIELEDKSLKQKLLENLDMAKNADALNVEIKAVLDHMTREKGKNQKN